MKNILKNTSLFIILCIVTFGFTSNVYADGECGDLDNNRCRIGAIHGVIKTSGGNLKYLKSSTQTTKIYYNKGRNFYTDIGVTTHFGSSNRKYYYGAYNDKASALYCLDAQYEGGNTLYAERFLLTADSSKKLQSFDYAIMSVLTASGSNPILSVNDSNLSDYWARLQAIRGITYLYGYYNNANTDYKNAYYAGLTTVQNWIKNDPSAFNTLNQAFKNAGLTPLTNVKSIDNNYYYTGSPVNDAQSYFNTALIDAAEFLNDFSDATGKVDTKTSPTASEITTTGEKGNEFISKDVVHEIKIYDFNSTDKFIINAGTTGTGVNLDGNYDGLTAYISNIEFEGGNVISGVDQVKAILGQNLVGDGYVTPGKDMTVKITVHFEGWKSSTDSNISVLKCGQSPIKYSISGINSASNFGNFGDYIAVIWYSGEAEAQRYIGIEKGQNSLEAPWTSSYETYLIEACNCDDLITACVNSRNLNSNACQELKESNCGDCSWIKAACDINPNSSECDEEKYAEVCEVTCKTVADTFECCDSSNNLIVSTLDNHEVGINGVEESEIKACFVSKMDSQAQQNGDGTYKNNANVEGVKDQKDNSFTLAEMKSNAYCSVSCKEDYAMTMPTAKLVNAGRYFTFKAKVEGTKTCYTNTIDRDKYNKDIVDAQVAMVDAYTEYLKWVALDSEPIKSRDEQRSASPCCRKCSGSGKNRSCSCTCSASDQTNVWTEYFVEDAKYTSFYVKDRSKNYNTGTISISSEKEYASYYEDGHVSGYCRSGCCYASCHDGISGKESTLKDNIAKNLKSAKNALQAAKEKYEAIIKEYNECSGWSSEINYDPNVYYDYDEKYLEKFNLEGKMDETKSTISSSEWYCNGTASSNGFYTAAKINDKAYTSCSTSLTGYRKTSIAYTVCTTNGCYTDYKDISDATYKKTTSVISAEYKPATLFYNVYPSGEITVNKSDNSVELTNKLPVALNTKRGIYKYSVNIENLGEFYSINSKNNLGRYVGASSAVIDPNKLEYNCSYLVNMPITDQDKLVCDFNSCKGNCDFDCIGPNCDTACDGGNCVADCIGLGCIYDEDAGTSLVEKIVSLSNLFPNGTNSYNWNANVNSKAGSTISEIQNTGNAIYDSTPILSITIDPSTARVIKAYNDSEEDSGGYSNSTMSCYSIDGYERVACYSSFISDLLDGKYGNNIVSSDSLIANDKYRTVSSDNKDYFTLWTERISENDMLGPSWK